MKHYSAIEVSDVKQVKDRLIKDKTTLKLNKGD